MIRIRASCLSVGGAVLSALFSVFVVVIWITFNASVSYVWLKVFILVLGVGIGLYVADGASETLTLSERTLVFDGWLTRRREINLGGVTSVALIHEGLNNEWGIEMLVFTYVNGDVRRLALGPLWRRGDLQKLIQQQV